MCCSTRASWESRPPAYNDQLPIRDQAVRLDTTATLRTKMIELDGKFLKTLTVQSWPVQWHGGEQSRVDWESHPVHRPGPGLSVLPDALNVLKFDQVKAKGKLRKRHVIINQQASGFLLGLIPSLKFKLDHYNGVQAQLENGRQLIGSYFQVVMGHPASRGGADRGSPGPVSCEGYQSAGRSLHRVEDLHDGVTSRLAVG